MKSIQQANMNNKQNSDDINSLTTDKLFRLADLHFNQKNYIYRHLYDSYNKFLEEDIKNFLEFGEHIFTESMTQTTYYRYRFSFANCRIFEPVLDNGIEPMFPADARHNSQTYSVKIVADITQYQDVIDIATDEIIVNKVGETEMGVPIVMMPLMLRSKWCSLITRKEIDKNECSYDPGGYFIINGNEKVIISQDRMVENKPLVFVKKDSGTLTHTVQVNSKSYKPQGITQIISVKMKKDNIITVKVPILNEVNVFALFRVLGLESDKDIISYITYDTHDTYMVDLIRISLDECKNEKGIKIQTTEEAIDFLIPKLRVLRRYTETNKETKLMQKKMHLLNLLSNSFLPHVEGGLSNKAYYLGYMINKLLKVVLGRATVDDRDSYINKRIDLPGDLLFELFRPQFKKMLGECKKFFDNRNRDVGKPINVISHIKPNTIEQGLKASLSTGNWIRRQGVSQMLQRLTYLQTISFLRRVDAPSGDASSSKLTYPRYLHSSSVGFLCCVQTPEHAKVGLTKHLSILSSISIMSADQYQMLKEFLKQQIINISDINPCRLRDIDIYKVFLNGDWMGMSENPIKLENTINQMRFNGEIDIENVSVVADHDECEIKVYCDSGRMIRPVISITDNTVNLKQHHIESISLNKINKLDKVTDWKQFLHKYKGVIDYVCVETQPYVMIADKIDKVEHMRQRMIESISKVKDIVSKHTDNRYDDMFYLKYTYCEIHPSLLFGEISTNVPFSHHNPGSRNIFQYAQGRQAMGMYSSNYRDRLDISFILYHVQKPIVSTRTSKYINSEILPSGENSVVAIACYTGYNQEDSLIFNKTSIDRGKFRSMYLKKYIISVQKNQSNSQDDVFMKPDPAKLINLKTNNFETLNDAGYAPEETVLKFGDAIFGKCTPTGDVKKPFKDGSEFYKMNAVGVVDRMYIGIQNNEGYETRKALIRSERIPNIGDKYCSRNGQKGTIGIKLKGTDMPFTKEGIRPDIILNPNAIPSRMSIGQLIECLIGKVAAVQGLDADGTAFESYDIEKLKQTMGKLGYHPDGTEYLTNGMTGEKMKVAIFIGPTYYQRLKHLVEDKIHARARGPKTAHTHQAPEGRSRDGGLRVGEMERDALLAHGMAKFTKEKLMDNSDAYSTFVCNICGLFATRKQMENDKAFSSDTDTYYCPSCSNNNDISKVRIPYAFKLFLQELLSMCIAARIRIKKNTYKL